MHRRNEDSCSPFLPAIIVLNAKYLPQSVDEPAQVGASSFTLSVLKVFHELGALRGLVLYARDESLAAPRTHLSMHGPILCATVFFNFRVARAALSAALALAFARLGYPSSTLPIVYYQTDTLLHYHPPGFPFAVTHHGPFVADFAHHFSEAEAVLAFGDADKVSLLRHQQDLGVYALVRASNGFALLHSALQRQFLLDAGVPHDRCCFDLTPPIAVPTADSHPLPEHIGQFLQQGAPLILLTAVARLDHFKNVPVILDVALTLLRRGIDLQVLIVGDPVEEDARRAALARLVPAPFASRVLIVPRLPKSVLYSLFAQTCNSAIFVCPSRYETLGITPLEAAAAGVATLVPDSTLVEVGAWFPPQYRVKAEMSTISERVLMMLEKGPKWHGTIVKAWVRKRTAEDRFRDSVVKAWTRISERIVRGGNAEPPMPSHGGECYFPAKALINCRCQDIGKVSEGSIKGQLSLLLLAAHGD